MDIIALVKSIEVPGILEVLLAAVIIWFTKLVVSCNWKCRCLIQTIKDVENNLEQFKRLTFENLSEFKVVEPVPVTRFMNLENTNESRKWVSLRDSYLTYLSSIKTIVHLVEIEASQNARDNLFNNLLPNYISQTENLLRILQRYKRTKMC